MEKYSQVIFDKNTVEFVTVAAEFCGFLERARDMKRYDFVDTALKILPLLYLKATLLPPCEPIGEDEPETFVTEEDYELIRRAIAGVLGAKDDYLEVFLPDMVYSDTPIKKCISEDLADIYQDLKDFISVFQLGLNETMNDSLVVCKEHFREFWGQRLVNTMRALHDVKYSPADASSCRNIAKSLWQTSLYILSSVTESVGLAGNRFVRCRMTWANSLCNRSPTPAPLSVTGMDRICSVVVMNCTADSAISSRHK